MTHTADDFRTARFATHPDGRIAARVVSNKHGVPWRRSSLPSESSVVAHVESDAAMAAGGWSPLNETCLPGVVTDEKVRAVAEAMWMHSEEPGTWDEASEDWLALARVALSTAPTTDEDAGVGPETRAAYRDLHTPETDEAHAIDWQAVAEHAEREQDKALAFAARWKETARHHIKHGRMFRASFNEAIKQRDHANARADLNAQSVATIEKQARTYALEQIEAAQAETTEAVTRAEKAEQERDEAIREAEELGEALDNVKPMDTMAAREHLDKAWEAAHVPVDGTIPAGAEYIERWDDGDVHVSSGGVAVDMPGSGEGYEIRLLDPPAPSRPDGAEAIQAVLDEWFATDQEDRGEFADFLAERGVRAPEDGAP